MAKPQPNRHRRTLSTSKPPVLLVKPHNIQFQTDERVSIFINRATSRGVAQYYAIAAKLPEFARNTAINDFLNKSELQSCSHIMFLDADTEPVDERAIERLLMLDKDVVCGVTPVKIGTDTTFQIGWNVQKRNDEGKHENYDIDELPKKLFKVDRVGGTTVMIKRHVLERLAKDGEPFQKSVFNDDMTNVKLSEDYDFSEKLTKAGFTIWCDPTVICRHYHIVDILDIMEVYRQAYQMGKNAK